jgi:hypothetical protein
MLYYVMWGTDVIAVCSRIEDAEAMSGFDPATKQFYQVVAKMVDTA